MNLSHEDSLRLNVLLTQELLAVKIDDSAMIVHALTSKGEAKVQLMPNCRDDRYLRYVRELFSAHVSDSPGGYPVYIKLWTRMGQTRTESLPGLLLLAEPEAIVAVANASGITESIARRAWWAMPTADIARSLLKNTEVSSSKLGQELAQFLVEFLPFETDTLAIVESVRLILQPGLIDKNERMSLWVRGVRKSVIRTGFLQGAADALPEKIVAYPHWDDINKKLKNLSDNNNYYAMLLARLLCAKGQAFLFTAEASLKKVSDQGAIVALLNSFEAYFNAFHLEIDIELRECGLSLVCRECRCFSEIDERITKLIDFENINSMQFLLKMSPELKPQIHAMLVLACVSEKLLDPVFAKTDAVGSLMRKKLIPVSEPLLSSIRCLM